MTFMNTERRRLKKIAKSTCSIKTVKKKLPIITWLPNYSFTILVQDIIAGITVGLTAIPQGIAYAVVAGLSPEYGLYAGLMGGFVYLFFGSCKDVTVGPTAIMAAMVSKYVSGYSPDFAVLVAFMAGIVELIMGILQLGFLVEFISIPVISGFTTAAALQIASAQMKSLFGLSGSSGNYFAESVYNFVLNIKTAKLWDPILGFVTIGILICLKKLGQGCHRTDGVLKQLRWFMSLGRNAVVVIFGIIVAFIVKTTVDAEPLALIGDIKNGLPNFSLPPFNTVVGNETYNFREMLQVLGPQSIVIPLVAILESVAIAKAFSGGATVDATQEMVALGLCNIIGSLGRSMPITGSFTRTALNHASGVQTPAGGVFTGALIILALTLMTSIFYFIPKASLAGLIITAMFSMIDYEIFSRLWKNSKKELVLLLITIFVCLSKGLEYGIVAGIVVEAVLLLFTSSRPNIDLNVVKVDKGEFIIVPLHDRVPYCAAEHVRRAILEASRENSIDSVIVVDAINLKSMDTTVAYNLMSITKDLEKNSRQVLFLNFSSDVKKMCVDINSKFSSKFVTTSHLSDLVDVFSKSA